MAETASPNVSKTETEITPVSPVSTPKKSKAKTAGPKRAVKKTTTDAVRPKTSEMVYSAIKELNERKGSSLQAIKKQIAATHKVDTVKMALFIRKYLKSAVASGELTQTKGTGASGSFKIPQAEKKTSTKSSSAAGDKKKVAKKVTKVASPKKVVKGKKTTEKKTVKATTKKEKTPAAKKSVKSKVAKSPKTAPKEKKSTKKLPTATKAKSPKVKRVPASRSKKATPKKK